jgi:hypothetical protein
MRRERLMAEIGQRVILKGAHPWSGYSGEIIEKRDTSVGSGIVIQLDNGIRAMAFPGDWRALTKVGGKRD